MNLCWLVWKLASFCMVSMHEKKTRKIYQGTTYVFNFILQSYKLSSFKSTVYTAEKSNQIWLISAENIKNMNKLNNYLRPGISRLGHDCLPSYSFYWWPHLTISEFTNNFTIRQNFREKGQDNFASFSIIKNMQIKILDEVYLVVIYQTIDLKLLKISYKYSY